MKSILVAGAVALLGTLFLTRFAIAFLVKRGYGQFIRDDGPTTHRTKRGTPTMGGIVIIVSVLLAYAVAHLVVWTAPTASGLLAIGLFTCLGLVGFADDWLKISHARSLGLHAWAKFTLQGVIAIVFGILAFQFPDSNGVTPASQAISFLRDLPWAWLPVWVAVIWIAFLATGWSNAVNLTDGLDGLATGACAMVFAAYGLVNIWQFNQSCGGVRAVAAHCYEVRDPHDLALVSLALAGACFGFLWWNASPAKIFMGDTGSLSLGGALAAISVMTRTELLTVLIGGLFVIITMSVILQVGWFKISGGKRLFKMAPLQHHFEQLGWAEVTVTIRFWIICGLFVALGLGAFYTEWVVGQ